MPSEPRVFVFVKLKGFHIDPEASAALHVFVFQEEIVEHRGDNFHLEPVPGHYSVKIVKLVFEHGLKFTLARFEYLKT